MNWVKRESFVRINKKDTIKQQIAKIRGIQDIDTFLNPPENVVHSPYLLKNIEEAAERIISALQNGERIAVSADVDADGVTSTAILIRYLRQFTDNVYYTYHQRGEGHGIENQIKMIDKDTKLIVVLDSSTNSTEACMSLQKRGYDVIIADHHGYERENPYALIVNPQLDDSPNKALSGAAVTYKLIQVIDDRLGTGTPEDFLDLVAVGLVADIMDMSVMENRYLVKEGLKNINNTGLLAILTNAKADMDALSSTTIGFTIAPMLNGVARMDRIELALELLVEDDFDKCKKLVKEMVKVNDERKAKEKSLTEMYEDQINPEDKVLIVVGTDPSKSFNGLVAQKIAQKYKRPTLVVRDSGKEVAGSFRSFNDFKIRTYLQNTPLVKTAVGHEYAGGVTILTENLPELRAQINADLAEEEFKAIVEFDLEFEGKDITLDLVEQLQEINRITGNGFEKVKVKINNLMVEERIVMGKNNDAIKIKTDCLDAIRFREDSEYASDLGMFDIMSLVGELNINKYFNWKFRKEIVSIQAFLDDYQLD
ncbi:DHH family phosphoesterase [Bacillus cereus]|uniref:single-stranded-DNA-specific exonuclease RecJ n=1 Tax=Bacillus thuringiensis TaxID=1428 RepID=UPI000B4465DA|nr:DHH family phosphoesterase [Bacillus thuringiensis]MEB9467857.1 DHH family phosphoesterase [Bacillus cereus]OUA16737.1 hypothetical protein BK776_30825 [Bacillus thuringiensis serovar aizawai]